MSGEEFAGTMPVAERQRFDLAALESYLVAHLPGFTPPLNVEQFRGGQSNPTFLLTGANGARYVLRKQPAGPLLPSAHAVDREFRVISALNGSTVPVAQPLCLCTDLKVIGTLFYVMSFAAGRNFWDPTLPGLLPTQRAAIYDEMNRVMVALHTLDYAAAGLGDYGKPGNYFSRQIARWSKQYRASATEHIEAMEKLISWLPANIPPGEETTLVHGDYRLDNLVLAPGHGRVRAVLDWEMSTFGDPLMDVALLLVYWEQPGDQLRQRVEVARELTTAPGFWTRDRLLSEYLRVTGLPPAHLDICLGLACLKLATILEGIHYRFRAGQALDELSAAMGTASPALIEMGLEVAAGHGLDALHR
jgi:aminoglycoside phosphotransferase (APT) family kinase protein